LVEDEPVAREVPAWPRHRVRFRGILESSAPVVREYGGPAFVLPARPCVDDDRVRLLGPEDRNSFRSHFDWLEREFAASEPVAGVFADGAVVALCWCARRKTAAVEAGVETAPAYRRRGYARDATARWAAAMRAAGRFPLYSTSWSNAASLAVAAALGAQSYAVDFHLA
jgi:RimJ/RimL family protein N-acetyltransferase